MLYLDLSLPASWDRFTGNHSYPDNVIKQQFLNGNEGTVLLYLFIEKETVEPSEGTEKVHLKRKRSRLPTICR